MSKVTITSVAEEDELQEMNDSINGVQVLLNHLEPSERGSIYFSLLVDNILTGSTNPKEIIESTIGMFKEILEEIDDEFISNITE